MKKSILSLLLFFASTCSFTTPLQSPKIVTNKIEQYVLNGLSSYREGTVHVSANKIDSRLSLQACAEAYLTVFNPYQSPLLETNTLGIKCEENENHWSLYVPIKITVMKTVYVAKRSLMKGDKIHKTDIYATEIDIHKLKYGYFTHKSEFVGQVCKQNIPINNPFNPHNIELAKIIHKGEKVAIIMNSSNLTVSMDGIAINEGTIGETIKVQNLSSKKIIEAQIAGEKKVTVLF